MFTVNILSLYMYLTEALREKPEFFRRTGFLGPERHLAARHKFMSGTGLRNRISAARKYSPAIKNMAEFSHFRKSTPPLLPGGDFS
jgi:hypothetical protein